MAEEPHKPGARPLSPFLTIYRWPITMVTSIVHRMTGVALAGGMVVLVWWLLAATHGIGATGILSFDFFNEVIQSPLGQIVLFGFVWSLAYHAVNGIRHLAWDLGYGFEVSTANATGILVFALSFVLAAAAFALAWTGHGGYYQ